MFNISSSGSDLFWYSPIPKQVAVGYTGEMCDRPCGEGESDGGGCDDDGDDDGDDDEDRNDRVMTMMKIM